MRTYDVIVVGAGSGNMLFGPELDGLRTAVVEPDRRDEAPTNHNERVRYLVDSGARAC